MNFGENIGVFREAKAVIEGSNFKQILKYNL